MHKSAFFRGSERGRNLLRDRNCRLNVDWTSATHTRIQVFAFDQLHGVKALTGFFANAKMMNRRDIGWRNAAAARFARETLARFRAATGRSVLMIFNATARFSEDRSRDKSPPSRRAELEALPSSRRSITYGPN
jgi:hypothetical protein